MILPTNGKVVVFDDVYNDVKGLLKALSKNRIPYNYYQDEFGEDLPDFPIKNVRVVFLDLQLISGQSVPDHTIISAIGIRLQKVIEPNNNYILIYWSTKEHKYKKIIDDAFNNGLKNYKPIVTISLNKVKALKEGNGIVKYIIKEINDKSEDFNLFKVFALWENLVNNSAGQLINDFTNFINNDDKWDDSTKYVLYQLAEAYSGKTVKAKDDLEKLKDAFFTLNHTLIDTIENRIPSAIYEKKDILTDVISNDNNGVEDYSSIINNKLLISQMNFNGNVPGCFFLLEEELELKKAKSKEVLDKDISNVKIPANLREKVIKKSNETHQEEIKKIDNYLDGIKKNFNVIANSLIQLNDADDRKALRNKILKDSIKIELNISPLCDYAQEKMQCVRLIPGLLLSAKYKDDIYTQNAYNYFSDCVIKFKDNDYYLLFDFRFLYSKSESMLKGRLSGNKLRHQLLSDIQLKLGSHVNRSGVIYVH